MKPLMKKVTGGLISITMAAAEPSRQAQASEHANQAFERLAKPFRREIKLHCYRMLGSLHEADDLVQETYLRAWRSFDSFEGGSFRAWLYRIATNACLNALASRKHVRRLLPDQQAPATVTVEMPEGAPPIDVEWLEPYPDSNLEGIADDAPNPEARYTSREAVQLAFVAAVQQLPPRQRAAILLCDVLGWAAAEAATLLGGSTASINSALQRARATLAKRYPDGRPPAAPDKIPRSKSSSAVIYRPGKGMIWTASWPSSKRTRPTPCLRGYNGMWGARRSGPSLQWLGRPVAAFALYRRQPTGNPLLPFMNALARTRHWPRTPSTCSRSRMT
jgi:RNA polymerase sigma factor (sigma-70 family)